MTEPVKPNEVPDVSKKEKVESLDNSKDDRIDIFPNLEVIFIGKHSFNNAQIINNFDSTDIDQTHLVALFKKVFQNKYPITRNRGLPKIPSKKTDRELLIKALYTYINKLRKDIISSRKQEGNSIVLREKIGHLEEIKILIQHFEDDKEKFPYHLFREYLLNADYYNSEGDIKEQLIKNRKRGDEDARIRNLLRQFAKLYLIQEGNDEITIAEPGVSREDFRKFRKTVEGNIPEILISLIDLLEGKTRDLEDRGEDVNYASLMKLLKELDSEFMALKDDVKGEDNKFATTQTGGDKTKDSEEAVKTLVNKIFDEYKLLKARERAKITTSSEELASIEATAKELEELRIKIQIAEAETKRIKTSTDGLDPAELDKLLKDYDNLDSKLIKASKLLAFAGARIAALIEENLTLKDNYNKVVSDGQGWVRAHDALKAKLDETTKYATEAMEDYQKDNKALQGKLDETTKYATEAMEDYEKDNKALQGKLDETTKYATEAMEDYQKDFKTIKDELDARKADGTECAVEYGKLSDKMRELEDTHERREELSNKLAMGAIRDIEKKHAKELKRRNRIEDKRILQTSGLNSGSVGSLFDNDKNSFVNEPTEVPQTTMPPLEAPTMPSLEAPTMPPLEAPTSTPTLGAEAPDYDEGPEVGPIMKTLGKQKPQTPVAKLRLDSRDKKDIKLIMNSRENSDNIRISTLMNKLKENHPDWTDAQIEEVILRLKMHKSRGMRRRVGKLVGGAKKLLNYSIQIADNRLNEFLTKQPLPFATLITDFEKSSNLSVVRETNEKYMLEEFVIYQLSKWFQDEKMKEFFYEFNKLFEKMKFIEMAKFCMSIYEICNAISKSEDTIDVARLESKDFNGLIDEIQNLLKSCQFDFYEVASKEMLKTKQVDIKYHDNHIYFKTDTRSSEHTYTIGDNLKLSKKSYDYNEDIYTINNKVIYFFFILSTYNVIKKDISENSTVQDLLRNTRTLKRNYKKSAKVRWQTKLT